MMTPGYLKDTHTPPRQVRIGDPWYEFQAALELMGGQAVGGGGERAENLREYIDWFLRKPGATMPKRPPADMAEQIRKRGAELKREAEAKAAARTRKKGA
ncbi:MAG: hypothetical protein HOY79_33855 [Streptomyces sp.]|nr:hypothetical protein [Streptomyces sp.]NUS11322.1 hypothetical protein [Streptomyces sp.]NUS23403.1 hypothetical protein [Streptomyces sp.]